MNKTRKKDTLRLIGNTKGRFFSLMAIIIIGVAFFVGVAGASYMMGMNVDAYADKTNLKDITVYSNYGFDDDDIKAINNLEEVEKAEGTKFVDVLANSSETSKVTRVHSYNEDNTINQFVLTEGRMPTNKNEALAEKGTDMADTFQIGDKITMSRPDDDLDDYLNITEVTIVGLIDTPLYINETKETSTLSNQYIATYLYIPEDAFSMDYYTEVNVLSVDGKSLYAFSDKYEEYNKQVKEDIEELAKTQSQKRKDKIVAEAKEEYNDGLEEYNNSLKEYEDGIAEAEQKIEDAKKEVESGKSEIASAKQKLKESQATLDSEYASNKATLDANQSEIDANKKKLDEQKSSVEALSSNIDNLRKAKSSYEALENVLNQLPTDDSVLLNTIPGIDSILSGLGMSGIDTSTTTVGTLKTQIQSQKSQILSATGMDYDTLSKAISGYDTYYANLESLNNAQAQLDAGRAELESRISSGQSQIDAGYQEISTNEKKLKDAEAEITTGEEELATTKEDGKKQLDEAKEKLDKALQDIESLEKNSWTVLDRTSHYGMETYASSVDQMAAIGNIFPVFFFLVAALVCLTTMTRMIDEERGQIGILRALGYTTFQCASKYLIYAASATFIGCLIGSILGTLTFPKIIYECWKMLYVEPDMTLYVPWHLIIAATVSFMLVMLGTTFVVCMKSMREVPSQLLRPASPKLGKSNFIEHIGIIWNHLSFTWKVTIRNLLRYKKRLVMTIIGVGGCTALMVIGFGVRDSINEMVNLQFDEITHYDGTAKISDDASNEVKNKIIQETKDNSNVESLITAVSYSGNLSYEGEEETVLTQVFSSNDQVSKLYTLRTRVGHKEITLDNSGIVISEKLSEDLGVHVGDTVTIESKYGVEKQVEVSAITEMYIQHYAFMTESLYEDLFETQCDTDTMFITTVEDDSSSLQKTLAANDDIESISFYDVTLDNFNNMVKTLDYIIIILISCSMALAFVVLGNLMNINISERQREIATLKVLGFRKKEVQSYVYKENNVLTVLGAFAGLPLGVALHHWIMHELQFSYVMYGVDVMPASLAISVIMTTVFGILVNRLMRKKLAQIEMVESLKSVE